MNKSMMKSIDKGLEEKNRNFFNALSEYYDFWILKKLIARIQEKALETIKIKKNSKILDVGFGTGNFLLMLKKENKSLKLYGVDISEKMLEIAGKKLGKNAELKLESAENLSFKNNYFDYVFSTEAFHHFSDWNKAVKNFYKVLKRKGLLMIVDFDFGLLFNKMFHAIEPGNSRMHSAPEFRKLFKKHNFKRIKQKRIGIFSVLTTGEK